MGLLNLGIWALLGAGCATPATPAVPAPTPTSSASAVSRPAPIATFGKVQAVRHIEESLVLAHKDQDPAKRRPGSALIYFVTVDGQEYAVHWNYADRAAAVQVGDTVNLHPSEYLVCMDGPDGSLRCQWLMKVYRNKMRIDPLLTR